jgi:hypothetical protein
MYRVKALLRTTRSFMPLIQAGLTHCDNIAFAEVLPGQLLPCTPAAGSTRYFGFFCEVIKLVRNYENFAARRTS